ncbi:hypothetical protein [Clostridioides difficile]|nr:hypothetical protein [Clostridioides difficile]SJV82042.1 Uncharacterised protein [Clostridioides difficile]
MNKKIPALAILIVLSLSLVGCSTNDSKMEIVNLSKIQRKLKIIK